MTDELERADLHIRRGVNPYGRCTTQGCFANRAQIVPLDDPKQVAAWNRRALSSVPAGGMGSNRKGDLSTEGHGAAVLAFIDGFRLALDCLSGPRVERPPHITDDQWVSWYGATRRDDGSFSAPMSVARLIPNPAHSKPSTLNHTPALALRLAVLRATQETT